MYPHQNSCWLFLLSHSFSLPSSLKAAATALSAASLAQVSISELNILQDWKALKNGSLEGTRVVASRTGLQISSSLSLVLSNPSLSKAQVVVAQLTEEKCFIVKELSSADVSPT